MVIKENSAKAEIEQAETEKEDRRFFRILDFIQLSVRELNDTEFQSLSIASKHAEIPSLDALADIDQQIQLLINKLKIKTPDVAALGNLLSKKIQLMVETSELGKSMRKNEDIPQRPVDMSACGIAFPSEHAFQSEQKLELEFILHSGKQRLKLLGRVIACEDDSASLSKFAGAPFTIRTEFLNVSDQVQEFLIQYLVKRQGALIKASRNDTPRPIDQMEW